MNSELDRPDSQPVLVVELEGALVHTSLLLESLLVLFKRKPSKLPSLVSYLGGDWAALKQRIAEETLPDVSTLPYREDFLEFLNAEKARGRELVLVSAADRKIVEAIANELGIFTRVFASDGVTSFEDEQKHERLVAEFGSKGFDYAGGSHDDLSLWSDARSAILVGPDKELPQAVEKISNVSRTFTDMPIDWRWHIEALRPYQWLKNILVFVPLVAAHQWDDIGLLMQAALAFVAFSFCASGIYLFNDLLDIPSDRHHPRKKGRPLAAGRLPLTHALTLLVMTEILAFSVAVMLPPMFVSLLLFYLVVMLFYSLRLKDVAILDVSILAGGYALRVFAGAAAVGIEPSPWLLAFCVFVFFSLALIKRYTELVTMRAVDGTEAHARAYVLEDSELIVALGGASGYLSVVVLALYISSNTAQEFYSRYDFLWLLCILLFYWISHMWLMAHRNQMHDDPLVFAIKDRTSRILIVLMSAVLLIAV